MPVGYNQQGYDAFYKGTALSSNPNQRGTLAHRMWRDGWLEAEEEDDEQCLLSQDQEKKQSLRTLVNSFIRDTHNNKRSRSR